MKLVFAITLSLSFLVSTISKTFIVLYYELNRDFIAANLCEKKDVEGNCCKGKCVLKSQLDKDDKNSDTQNPASKYKLEKNEFCDTGSKMKIVVGALQKNIETHFTPILNGHASLVFHPPCERSEFA